MENYTIRLVKPEDAAEILGIYSPYIENTVITFEYEVPSLEAFRTRITQICHYYPYLVCQVAGRIVGYAYASRFRERAAFQWDVEASIYLHPDAQGKGIAKRLYHALFEILSLQKFCNVYSYICYPNEKSIGLHEHFGFTECARYENAGYKHNDWRTLVCLTKQLNLPAHPETPLGIGELDQTAIDNILSNS